MDGVIGGDFFTHHVVKIDYRKKQLQVWNEKHTYHGPDDAIPVMVEHGHIYTNASLRTADGRVVAGRFMIDTGVRVPILLDRPFASEQHIFATAASIPGVTVGIGAGAETRGTVSRLANLRIGALQLDNVIALSTRL